MKTSSVIGAALGTTALVAAAMGAPAPALATDAPTQAAAAAASQKATAEYQITDSSYYLGDYLAANLGDATVVKINTYSILTGSTVIPAQVKQLVGWDQNMFFNPDGSETVRTVGYYKQPTHTLTWQKRADCEVRSITFDLVEDKLTVPAGATVTFKNCTFNDRIVVEQGGKAVFEDCTFKTGTINNNGQASYTGTTVEPTNTGNAEVAFQDIDVKAAEPKLADAMHNYAYEREVALNVTGTNAADAELSAEVLTEDSGISAEVKEGKLVLSGTPNATGTVEVKVSATADDASGSPQTSEDIVSIEVSQEYKLVLEGSFDPIRLTQSFNDTNYRGGLTVFVEDEDGNKVSLNEWSSDGYKFELAGLPTGAGYNVVNAGGSYHVGLTGTPEEQGFFDLAATLTYHGATIKADPVSLRVYPENVSLADSLKLIEGEPTSWDMEPFELTTSGNAVIPTWLQHIYGSHESGLYGQIGNATDAYGSDTITIPAGTNVELVNIKVNSSVKIVVEKGATLTLTDSVVFGDIEVNGGTLVMTPEVLDEDSKVEVGNSAICGTVTLNDGSTVRDSFIDSNADFLTDGSYAEMPAQAVVVNGTVTFEGDVAINGALGQIGLAVNGTAVVPEGSTLTVSSSDSDVNSSDAAAALELNGGTVTGDGTLVATGGSTELGGKPGRAIVGTGTISTKGLVATGGSSNSIFSTTMDGADALDKTITLLKSLVDSYTITGGKGSGEGTTGKGVESATIVDNTTTKYAVSVTKAEGGSVSTSRATASKGTKVYVTVTPEAGYRVASLRVTTANGTAVDLTPASGHGYTFTMPAAKVSVEAAFVKVEALTFSDADAQAWYASSLDYVSAHGIMNGYKDDAGNLTGVFGVGRQLTRGEFASLLYNLMAPGIGTTNAKNETNLPDIKDGQFYTAAANWAVKNGIINGYELEDGSRAFAPDDPVTLEQMVAIIANLAVADTSSASTDALKGFVDADSVDEWATQAVAWGVEAGVFSGSIEADGLHIRPTEPMTRERVATVITNAINKGILG